MPLYLFYFFSFTGVSLLKRPLPRLSIVSIDSSGGLHYSNISDIIAPIALKACTPDGRTASFGFLHASMAERIKD